MHSIFIIISNKILGWIERERRGKKTMLTDKNKSTAQHQCFRHSQQLQKRVREINFHFGATNIHVTPF